MQGKAVPQATKGPVAASLNKELPPPPPPLPARPSPAPPVGDDVEMTEDNGGERAETASVVSSQTLVNATETSSDQSYVKVSASDESPGKTTSSSVVEINSEDLPALMDVNDKPDAANKDVTMADASGTAEPEPSKVPIEKRISNALDHSVRQGTEQQDVEEVMGNIIQRLHSAIRPTYEDAENKLQMDKITETFYCTMVNYTRKTEGGFNKEVIHERWLTAFPGTERISLYDALDRSFDLHYVEGTKLPRYTAIRALPPILHVCIQRSVENGRKNGNPVTLPDTLYLDRYMDQGVDSELMEARKLSWALKLRLRQLKDQESLRNNKDAEPHPDFLRDVVYEKEALPAYLDDGMVAGPSKPGPEDVPSILGFLTPSLQREVADLLPPPKPSPAALSASAKQRANPAPPTFDLSGGFQESALEEQQRLTAQLESLFSNMKREAYRLHAVICHQGQAARSGHYWVYIRDFESGRWRKYNDSRITEVSGDLDLKGEEYYVAYVREDMTTTAVDIPKRIISDEDLARLQQAQAVKLPRDAPDATTSNQATAADANGMDENANGASSSRNKADADAATKQPPAIEMQDFESEARHGQQEQLPRYDGAEWGPGYADGV